MKWHSVGRGSVPRGIMSGSHSGVWVVVGSMAVVVVVRETRAWCQGPQEDEVEEAGIDTPPDYSSKMDSK